MCARSSRRLSRAGRSRGSDAGGLKPPSGRPHGAEQRGRGVHPIPRPHSAVPEAGAKLGWGGAWRAADRRWRIVKRCVLCFCRPGPGGAAGASGAGGSRGVGRLALGLAEQQELPSCSRLPRGLLQVAWAESDERLQSRFRSVYCVCTCDSFLDESRLTDTGK